MTIRVDRGERRGRGQGLQAHTAGSAFVHDITNIKVRRWRVNRTATKRGVEA